MVKRTKSLILVLYIVIANLVDAILTYTAVTAGEASEMNPLMEFLLDLGGIYFFLVKISLVTLGLILLLLSQNQKIAHYALWVCAATYTIILTVHASMPY